MRPGSAHVIGAVAIAASLTAGIYRSNVHAGTFGGDFEVVCAAGDVLEQQGNPYQSPPLSRARDISATPMTYPPLTAIVLRPICGRIAPLWFVLAGAAVLLALTARLPGVRAAQAAWAIAGGCAAFPWLVLTGNVMALAEGFCGVAAVWAMVRGRPRTFGAAIGLAAFGKLMPAAYLLAAFVRWPVRSALPVAMTAFTVFAALQLLTYAVAGHAFAQYWSAVATGWDGFVEAELRFGSENNPSMFSFLPIAAAHAGLGVTAGYTLAAAIAIGFAAGWFRAWRAHGESEPARFWLAVLAMGVIAVTYPRFKPYSIVFLLPAMAMMFARLRGTQLTLALVMACVLPNVALIAMTWLAVGPPTPVPVVFALQYAQWVLIAAALALALTPAVLHQLIGQPAIDDRPRAG